MKVGNLTIEEHQDILSLAKLVAGERRASVARTVAKCSSSEDPRTRELGEALQSVSNSCDHYLALLEGFVNYIASQEKKDG